MRIYRVGGSVRDELLGHRATDDDFVVVGATPEQMVERGFRPVGRDFPVFIDPATGSEYALARTERKSGPGHRGFVFHASPEVTLEDDLRRRDITINAMARDGEGRLIDPYGGERDLRAGILRHVSGAFAEDPLRVLRVARFAARFGFSVADETEALMRRMVASGELDELSPERVWQELSRGLESAKPSAMLAVLRSCGALATVLPEIDRLFGVALPLGRHPGLDAGVHALASADYAATAAFSLPARFAALVHAVAHASAGVAAGAAASSGRPLGAGEAVARLAVRLRAPVDCRDAGAAAAELNGDIASAASLTASEVHALLRRADALRRPERLHRVIDATEACVLSRPGCAGRFEPRALLVGAREAVAAVDAGAIAARHADSSDLPERIREAQVAALADWLANNRRGPPAA